MSKFPYFSHNGMLRSVKEATVALDNLEYSYGFGVYESIRCAKGAVYFLNDHIERLLHSAEIIELEHSFDATVIRRSILELVRSGDGAACNLKVLLIGGAAADQAQLYVQCLSPLFPERRLYQKGAKVITRVYERAFPQAKTLNMLQSYLCYRDARRQGAYDALLVNATGHITEGTRTNFFGMRGSVLVSPPEEEILLGVTRKAVLEVAKAKDFSVVIEPVKLSEISNFDAMFITSTSSKIMPICEVEEDILYDSPTAALRRLMKYFDEYLVESKDIKTLAEGVGFEPTDP